MSTETRVVDELAVAQLARLIKRAAQSRGWCRTPPLDIARALLAQGVKLPTDNPRE